MPSTKCRKLAPFSIRSRHPLHIPPWLLTVCSMLRLGVGKADRESSLTPSSRIKLPSSSRGGEASGDSPSRVGESSRRTLGVPRLSESGHEAWNNIFARARDLAVKNIRNELLVVCKKAYLAEFRILRTAIGSVIMQRHASLAT